MTPDPIYPDHKKLTKAYRRGNIKVIMDGVAIRNRRFANLELGRLMKGYEAEFAMQLYLGLKVEISVIFD